MKVIAPRRMMKLQRGDCRATRGTPHFPRWTLPRQFGDVSGAAPAPTASSPSGPSDKIPSPSQRDAIEAEPRAAPRPRGPRRGQNVLPHRTHPLPDRTPPLRSGAHLRLHVHQQSRRRDRPPPRRPPRPRRRKHHARHHPRILRGPAPDARPARRPRLRLWHCRRRLPARRAPPHRRARAAGTADAQPVLRPPLSRRDALPHDDLVLFDRYEQFLAHRNLVDFDTLVTRPPRSLEGVSAAAATIRARWERRTGRRVPGPEPGPVSGRKGARARPPPRLRRRRPRAVDLFVGRRRPGGVHEVSSTISA